MDKKKILLNEFITQVVDGWMLSDLESLKAIPHKPGAAGNCNFPIALYVFSCIEFLGQLTYSKTSLPEKGYTKESVLGYIDDFFPEEFKTKLESYKDDFVNVFRNGLAHNYFAKSAGVSRTKSEPFSVEDGYLVLDADRFSEAFKLSVEKLKTTIQTDAQLVEKIVDRYEAQKKSYAKFKLDPTLPHLQSALASGASLPHPSMLEGLTTITTSTSELSEPSNKTTTLPPSLDLEDKE